LQLLASKRGIVRKLLAYTPFVFSTHGFNKTGEIGPIARGEVGTRGGEVARGGGTIGARGEVARGGGAARLGGGAARLGGGEARLGCSTRVIGGRRKIDGDCGRTIFAGLNLTCKLADEVKRSASFRDIVAEYPTSKETSVSRVNLSVSVSLNSKKSSLSFKVASISVVNSPIFKTTILAVLYLSIFILGYFYVLFKKKSVL
jgi:hypothetical protein